MTNVKEFKRPNGDKVSIRVTLQTFGLYGKDGHGNQYRYDVQCLIRLKGKRTDVFYKDATDEEIMLAKLELWNKIKPA